MTRIDIPAHGFQQTKMKNNINNNRLKTKFNEENVDREKINNNNKRVLKYMHICITCISQ